MRVLAALDGHEISNFTPSPKQYLFASPAPSDNMLVVASDNGQVNMRMATPVPRITWSPLHIAGPIKAGKTMEVKLTITNNGTVVSRNIRLQLREQPGYLQIDAPFEISHLSPGKNATVVFNWTPREDSKSLAVSIRDDVQDYYGPWLDIRQPEKEPYPAAIVNSSVAVLILVVVLAAIIALRRSRKGGAG
jgi:hypothetical protein